MSRQVWITEALIKGKWRSTVWVTLNRNEAYRMKHLSGNYGYPFRHTRIRKYAAVGM